MLIDRDFERIHENNRIEQGRFNDDGQHIAVVVRNFQKFLIFTVVVCGIVRYWVYVIKSKNVPMMALCAIFTIVAILVAYKWGRWVPRDQAVHRYAENDFMVFVERVNPNRNDMRSSSNGLPEELLALIPFFQYTSMKANNEIADHSETDIEEGKLDLNDSENIGNSSALIQKPTLLPSEFITRNDNGDYMDECGNILNVAEGCIICLNDYKNMDYLSLLPCSHIYHKSCIEEWLRRNNKCPLCKHKVFSDLLPDHSIESSTRFGMINTNGATENTRQGEAVRGEQSEYDSTASTINSISRGGNDDTKMPDESVEYSV
jgi:hypothetical protein